MLRLARASRQWGRVVHSRAVTVARGRTSQRGTIPAASPPRPHVQQQRRPFTGWLRRLMLGPQDTEKEDKEKEDKEKEDTEKEDKEKGEGATPSAQEEKEQVQAQQEGQAGAEHAVATPAAPAAATAAGGGEEKPAQQPPQPSLHAQQASAEQAPIPQQRQKQQPSLSKDPYKQHQQHQQQQPRQQIQQQAQQKRAAGDGQKAQPRAEVSAASGASASVAAAPPSPSRQAAPSPAPSPATVAGAQQSIRDVRARILACGSPRALLALCSRDVIISLDADGVFSALAKLAKLCVTDPSDAPAVVQHSSFALLLRRCEKVAPDMQSRQVAACCAALARLNLPLSHPAARPLLAALVRQARTMLAAFRSQELATMAWAISSLDYGDTDFLLQIADELATRPVRTLSPHDIASGLRALVRSSVVHKPLMRKVAEALSVQPLSVFSTQQLWSLLYAYCAQHSPRAHQSVAAFMAVLLPEMAQRDLTPLSDSLVCVMLALLSNRPDVDCSSLLPTITTQVSKRMATLSLDDATAALDGAEQLFEDASSGSRTNISGSSSSADSPSLAELRDQLSARVAALSEKHKAHTATAAASPRASASAHRQQSSQQ